ncbi:MAG: hypothetical protein KAJ91_05135, partial [Candidatus Aenigmarchaeota archaeon]|nr:hypothetical protein [Candidatus Aenigmarchaeota archaeon]
MRPFCEIMVQDIFPTVRALIAKELTCNLGHTQREAAARMGVTQPAISQYGKELRGRKAEILEADKRVQDSIKDAARTLTQVSSPYEVSTMCNICKEIRGSGAICGLHKAGIPELKNCTVCLCDEPSSKNK